VVHNAFGPINNWPLCSLILRKISKIGATSYGLEGLRQVSYNNNNLICIVLKRLQWRCATLLGACHVPERPCGGLVYLGRYNKCSPLPLPFLPDVTFYYYYLICTRQQKIKQDTMKTQKQWA